MRILKLNKKFLIIILLVLLIMTSLAILYLLERNQRYLRKMENTKIKHPVDFTAPSEKQIRKMEQINMLEILGSKPVSGNDNSDSTDTQKKSGQSVQVDEIKLLEQLSGDKERNVEKKLPQTKKNVKIEEKQQKEQELKSLLEILGQ